MTNSMRIHGLVASEREIRYSDVYGYKRMAKRRCQTDAEWDLAIARRIGGPLQNPHKAREFLARGGLAGLRQ